MFVIDLNLTILLCFLNGNNLFSCTVVDIGCCGCFGENFGCLLWL